MNIKVGCNLFPCINGSKDKSETKAHGLSARRVVYDNNDTR